MGFIGELLRVPVNVKQMMLPFVLDPSSIMNSTALGYGATPTDGDNTQAITEDKAMAKTEETLGPGKPDADESGSQMYQMADRLAEPADKKAQTKAIAQFFSFRTNSPRAQAADPCFGRINICPSSFKTSGIVSDIDSHDAAFQSLFDRTREADDYKVTFQDSILNRIPGIKIREFIPDAKITQIMNIFSAFAAGWDMAQSSSSGDSSVSELASDVWQTCVRICRNIGPIFQDVVKKIDNRIYDIAPDVINNKDDDWKETFILRLPYILYYKLMSSMTTNFYEVPFDGTVNDESSGSSGWSASGIQDLTMGNSSFLGKIWNYFGSQLSIAMTPTWNGQIGANGGKSYSCKFRLFNDTAENAIINYIFVNTLVPNNKMMNYHIYNHSPCLYDIKIDGVGREFMCTGTFSYTGLGPLREIPVEMLGNSNENISFSKRVNDARYDKDKFLTHVRDNKLIKIPDVYEVSMNFSSLLPSTFNTYLFQFCMKNNFETDEGADLYRRSAYHTISETIVSTVKEEYNAVRDKRIAAAKKAADKKAALEARTAAQLNAAAHSESEIKTASVEAHQVSIADSTRDQMDEVEAERQSRLTTTYF